MRFDISKESMQKEVEQKGSRPDSRAAKRVEGGDKERGDEG
jgi:hypothetical protein